MRSPPPAATWCARRYKMGCLREFDPLLGEDGTVDLVCDPGLEVPLEFENRTLTLAELLDALQQKRQWTEGKAAAEAA